jgi:hypothetical protein
MKIPPDFTVYLRRNLTSPPPFPHESAVFAEAGSSLENSFVSRACTISFDLEYSDGMKRVVEQVTAHSLICSCFRGQYYSVTCRLVHGSLGDGAVAWPEAASLKDPGSEILWPAIEPRDRIAEMIRELIHHVWGKLEIENRRRLPTGLIVVAGRTGSGKSLIARALARRFMEYATHLHGGRRPHLLTYEDPIEELFHESPEAAARSGIDYTPREKGVDVPSLEAAARDALRQTPALFYVGETRDEKDWGVLLRFAETGLAITTSHTGSLVETMGQILRAAKARSPAERSRVVERIAALVHLRPHLLEAGEKVLIPAFWFRSKCSISSFTAEGLGALLPNLEEKGSCDSYGRAYAVKHLSFLSGIEELLISAVEWDLRGD